MSHVQLEHIEASIKKIDTLDDTAIDRLSETHTTAQPVLLGYVMSAAEEYQNESLEPLLIYYYTVILEAYSQASIHPKTVTDDMIDEFEEPFFQLLDHYFETEDENALEEFSDEPFLVQFMAMEISSEDADGVSLDDETATQLFIVTLAMISLLRRAV